MSKRDANDIIREHGPDRLREMFDRSIKQQRQQANGGDRREPEMPTGLRRKLADVVATFDKWLILRDYTPLYAVLATVAVNSAARRPGLARCNRAAVVGKNGNSQRVASVPHVRAAATVTPAALLSGTPKRQKDKGSKGGLLREIGDFGIIVMKDFGSLLSVRPDAKAELLAALREIYDGSWTRHIGSDGGRTLSWLGKVGFALVPLKPTTITMRSSVALAIASCSRASDLTALAAN